MISRWKQGYEVVGTIRRDPPGTGALKKYPSMLFYKLMDKISDLHLPAGAADFRLVGPRAAAALRGMTERSRFFRGLAKWVGYRQCWVEYTADVRFSGGSRYSLTKMARLAIDGVTSFSTSPLRMSVYLGLVCALLSFVYIVYALYIKLAHQALIGWTSILIAVLFLGGVQLVSIGILGEYVGRLYEEAKGRKLYLVSEELGFPEKHA
jgi:dolichol-phosphate mannosyltransferase